MSSAGRNPEEEKALIQRIRDGERQLFYELVRPHERSVYLAAFAILRNESDAEEIAQEAMLKAFAHLDGFRAESRFGTWLIQIAINEARMRRRKDHGDLMTPLDASPSLGSDEAEYTPPDFADWREIPSEALERRELREALARALASLPDIYREVFILRDVRNLDTAQTSELLGISEGAVKTRLLRARLQMREALGPELGEDWRSPEPLREGEEAVVVSCEQVRRELSDYADRGARIAGGAAIEAHLAGCARCAALLAGMRNIVHLARDERAFPLPAGFSERWRLRLAGEMHPASGAARALPFALRVAPSRRRKWLGTSLVWATAAATLLAALSMARYHNPNAWRPKSWHSQPPLSIPSEQVAIDPKGKLFHEAGCEYLTGKGVVVSCASAVRAGYTPCVRCQGELLRRRPVVGYRLSVIGYRLAVGGTENRQPTTDNRH